MHRLIMFADMFTVHDGTTNVLTPWQGVHVQPSGPHMLSGGGVVERATLADYLWIREVMTSASSDDEG